MVAGLTATEEMVTVEGLTVREVAELTDRPPESLTKTRMLKVPLT